MEFVVSVLVGLLLMEVYAWLPSISMWLLERFVRQVVLEQRARCREEWKAGLDAMPNTMWRFLHALSFAFAAKSINADFFESNCLEIDSEIADLTSRVRALVEEFRRLKANRAESTTRLEHARRSALASLDASPLDTIPDQLAKDTLKRALDAYEAFAGTLCHALGRASDLMSVSIDSSSVRLVQLEGLLNKASVKRGEIVRHGTGSCATDAVTALRISLNGDLAAIRGALEDDKWGDDVALDRHRRLMGTVQEVLDNWPGTRR
jgi:hypothetical protein